MMRAHLVFLEAIYGYALALRDQCVAIRDVTIPHMHASLPFPNSFRTTGLNNGLHNSRNLNDI